MLLDVVAEHPDALLDLVGPPMLPAASRAWVAWADLSARRTAGQSIEPVKFTEIVAWQQVTGRRLTPLDLHLLLVADDVFIKVAMERLANRDTPPPTPEKDE